MQEMLLQDNTKSRRVHFCQTGETHNIQEKETVQLPLQFETKRRQTKATLRILLITLKIQKFSL